MAGSKAAAERKRKAALRDRVERALLEMGAEVQPVRREDVAKRVGANSVAFAAALRWLCDEGRAKTWRPCGSRNTKALIQLLKPTNPVIGTRVWNGLRVTVYRPGHSGIGHEL